MKSLSPVSWNDWECGLVDDSGTYQLLLSLDSPAVIVVGALGPIAFPRGTYIYTGRASKGLRKRVARHRRSEKKLRWHIDYLLQHARVIGVRVFPRAAAEECSINDRTGRELGGRFPVQGFGSSDCGCQSHLALIPEKEAPNLSPLAWMV